MKGQRIVNAPEPKPRMSTIDALRTVEATLRRLGSWVYGGSTAEAMEVLWDMVDKPVPVPEEYAPVKLSDI